MLFCAPIIGLWYWCTDQYIVQRALGAPNETQARRGSHFCRVLEAAAGVHLHHSRHHLLALAKERQGAGARRRWSTRTARRLRSESQAAFPLMVKNVLPVGVRGVVVAGCWRR